MITFFFVNATLHTRQQFYSVAETTRFKLNLLQIQRVDWLQVSFYLLSQIDSIIITENGLSAILTIVHFPMDWQISLNPLLPEFDTYAYPEFHI